MMNEKNDKLDEFKKKLNSIYSEALSIINKYSDFTLQNDKETESNKNYKDKATLNIILKLLNDYEEASMTYIQNILQENIRLKSSLMSTQSMLDIYLEKMNEIVEISKGQSDNYTESTNKLDSKSISNVYNGKLEQNEEVNLNGKNSHILNNLNRLRENILEMSEKEDLQKNYIFSLKEKLKNKKEEKKEVNLIVQVPKWMPDDYITHCMKCEKVFSYGRWKHHCRVCGNIFCSTCCANYNVFEPFYLDPVRTCDDCHTERKYNKYR